MVKSRVAYCCWKRNSIEVLEFHHEVRIPTDPDTGALTGTRKHEAFQIIKAFDQSSPLLYKAVCEGITYDKMKVDWYKIDDQGQRCFISVIFLKRKGVFL